MKGGVWGG
ncbi:hypothetical protein AYI68_g8345, partial [Smittium mucronatum]